MLHSSALVQVTCKLLIFDVFGANKFIEVILKLMHMLAFTKIQTFNHADYVPVPMNGHVDYSEEVVAVLQEEHLFR